MYDVPDATAALWSAIRARLGYGPETLTQSDDVWAIWRSPDLLLSQTCGLPFRARLQDDVTLVGTPDYGLPGCPPGYYNSVFIARAAADLPDLNGTCFAYNDDLSQSGWAAPIQHLHRLGLRPGSLLMSGSHAASARAVAEGRADFAALDALTFALLQDAGALAGVHEIARTSPTPGLPFITAKTRDADAIRTAIVGAISDLPPSVRDALHLRGLYKIPAKTYMAQPVPPSPRTVAA